MIKSTIETPSTTSEEAFQLLARHKQWGFVVLFIDYREGVVVSDSLKRNFGYHTDGWVNCMDNEAWEILPKGTKVTLEVV